jgi:DUF4097 and DUF4098 domain-containing protein YvlB
LIGIGGAFLMRNMVPEFPVLDYLARYWPYLLILWGVMRLVEISIWATQGRPLPTRGLHGGEWTLVVFLCLIGFSLNGFRTWALPGLPFWGERYDFPETAEVTVATATPRIVLEQFRGNARIVGADGMAVKVNGHRSIRSLDEAAANRISEEMALTMLTTGDYVTITQPQDKLTKVFGKDFSQDRNSFNVEHDVDIIVPKGSTVIVKGRSSYLEVTNVDGSVEVTASDSRVRAENIGGDVRMNIEGSDLVRAVNLKSNLYLQGRGNDIDLENIAGQVNAGGSWSGLVQMRALAKPAQWKGLYTTMTVEGIPGEIRVTTGDVTAFNVTGPLRIESTNKDLNLTDVNGPTDITLKRGDVRITATKMPVSDIRLRSEGGEVNIDLPAQSKFNLNAVTERGDAHNGFGADVTYSETDRGATLRRSAGGATVDVHVTRGDIAIRTGGLGASFPETPRMPRVERPEMPERPRQPEMPKGFKALPEAFNQ